MLRHGSVPSNQIQAEACFSALTPTSPQNRRLPKAVGWATRGQRCCSGRIASIRNFREARRKQIEECSKSAAKKTLTKQKSARPSEAALADLIAGEFEELTR
jgi:hypothetical protein